MSSKSFNQNRTVRDLIAPLSLATFKRKYFGKQAFSIVRETNPFEGLVSLTEIEAKLNDDDFLPKGVRFLDRGRKTTPDLTKAQFRQFLKKNYSFVCYEVEKINREVALLVNSVEKTFPSYRCALHIFVSPSADSTRLIVHTDVPQHKFYLQLMGKTQWTIYQRRSQCPRGSRYFTEEREIQKYLRPSFKVVLKPGSLIYLPPDTFHRVTPYGGPRVSLSFPFDFRPKLKKNAKSDEHPWIRLIDHFQENAWLEHRLIEEI